MTRAAVERRYATLKQAAEWYGISERTIRRSISEGKLTGYRLGKRILRVDMNEVDLLMRPIPTAGVPNDAA